MYAHKRVNTILDFCLFVAVNNNNENLKKIIAFERSEINYGEGIGLKLVKTANQPHPQSL